MQCSLCAARGPAMGVSTKLCTATWLAELFAVLSSSVVVVTFASICIGTELVGSAISNHSVFERPWRTLPKSHTTEVPCRLHFRCSRPTMPFTWTVGLVFVSGRPIVTSTPLASLLPLLSTRIE